MTRVAGHGGQIHIGCMYLEEGGLVGYHEAVVNQLFFVVQGEGWVRGESDEKVQIQAGEAAFWQKNEGHEAGTDTSMTAIVLEAEGLDPAQLK